jgi:3-oxoacyl-[acyl-carrier protein] reductase
VDVRGCAALVTGAGSGIGRATALRLARDGAAVVVGDVDRVGGLATVQTIRELGGHGVFVEGDVCDAADVARMVEAAAGIGGGLAVLVNSAGSAIRPPYFPQADASRWLRTLDVYLHGPMRCIQAACAAMQARGGGVIVTVASGAGLGLGPNGIPEYAAAKAALVRLTPALGTLRASGIRVNCVCPGWVDTSMTRGTLADVAPEDLPGPAPAVMLAADEVAAAVVELVRDDETAGRVMVCEAGRAPFLLPDDGA